MESTVKTNFRIKKIRVQARSFTKDSLHANSLRTFKHVLKTTYKQVCEFQFYQIIQITQGVILINIDHPQCLVITDSLNITCC